jgi:hypothetical protein
VVGDGKARFGGRGIGAVRRREEEPKWEGNPPLQPRAVDKGARGGARGQRLWRSSGHRHMAEQLLRACEASDRTPFKRRLRLTSGPGIFLIY